MKRISKHIASDRYGICVSGPNEMNRYYLMDNGSVVDDTGCVRYVPKQLDLRGVCWRNTRATEEFVQDNAAELAWPEKMTADRLGTAATYCDAWENPFSEELVKRAGSWRRYSESFRRPDRIKIIQNAAKSFGFELL